MATYVVTATQLVVNSVDLTDHIEECTFTVDADEVEFTNMASAGWREFKGGLKKGTLNVTWQQDFAASEVDATLWAALGTVVAFTSKATAASTSATNPEYQGNVLISKLTTVGGAVGAKAGFTTTWPTSGAVTRAV